MSSESLAPAPPAPVAVSVVIPCRNGAATLPETLDGLVTQCWDRPWEIVLADNGSTDASAAVFEATARRHPEIAMRRVDASAEAGQPYALNVGMAAARAPAIAFCDADDVPGTGWLAAMGAALAEHPIVASRIDFGRLNRGWAHKSRDKFQTEAMETLPFLPCLVHAGGGTMGVQRAVIDRIGGFDPDFPYLLDTEFCVRAQLAGYSIRFVPEAVMHVRARDDLRRLFRQSYNWGRYEMKLVARNRDRVPFAGGWRHYVQSWRRLLRHHLRKGLRPRPETMLNAAWLRAGAGRLTGWLVGMALYRVPPYRPPEAG